MIITSNIRSWIMVDDIGVKIPPEGKGELHINANQFNSSQIIMDLLNRKIINIDSFQHGIAKVSLDGKSVYSVPSNDVWGSSGNSVKLNGPMRDESVYDVPKKMRDASPQKKFKVVRKSPYSVCLDSIGLVLSKHVPELMLTESQYYDECTQLAISNGSISLSEIFEESVSDAGTIEWLPVKNRENRSVDSLIAPESATCVHWEGPMFDGGGYANMNRQIMFNMDDMGVHVKPSIVSTTMDVEKSVQERLLSLSHNLIPIQSPKVYGTTLPSRHCGRSIGYTMIETEEVIHPVMAQKLKVADEIWVPSEWNRRLFENSGVTGTIKVMPLGVDHETYRPDGDPVYFDKGVKGFTFLSVFNWNWRKGFDAMLKAYIRAFTDKDDVSLVMVSRYTAKNLPQKIFSDIEKYTSNERRENRPHLALVNEVIPTFLMPRLYNSADAFCLLSRGEGWCLPLCEAASAGLPVLGADHGGQQMFLNEDNSLLVRPDMIVDVHEEVRIFTPFYDGMKFVSYSDKAIDEAAEKMRWMYENPEKLQGKADAARQNILNNFTWKHAAQRVADRLSEIQP